MMDRETIEATADEMAKNPVKMSPVTKDLLTAACEDMRKVAMMKAELCENNLQKLIFARAIWSALIADLALSMFTEAKRVGASLDTLEITLITDYAGAVAKARDVAEGKLK